MVDEPEDASLKNERRFAAIERDVAVIRSNYTSKEDVARLELRLVKWAMATMAASVVAAVGAVASMAKLFLG